MRDTVREVRRSYVKDLQKARINKPNERFDIQRLRAVAVTLVVANHLWGWPVAGFVGVDIFFVISGFLITGLLLRSQSSGLGVALRTFYVKRMKRIFPAACVVLALTAVVAGTVFLPSRSASTRQDAVSALFFVSNWRFAFSGGNYFATQSSVSPVRHFWSLSIEEQYYLVWPILLLAALFAGKKLAEKNIYIVLAALALTIIWASFLWSLLITRSDPSWAYFDTFSRIWELSAGSLLAVLAQLRGFRNRIRFRSVISYIGLLVLAVSVFTTPTVSGFPAPWALLPVSGAMLVITAGVGSEPSWNILLNNPVCLYVGDISYSLYLWHWPVIVFLTSVMPRSPSFYTACIALSLAGAIFSYSFIENPIRYMSDFKPVLISRTASRRVVASSAVAALALAELAVSAYMFRPSVRPDVAAYAELSNGDSTVQSVWPGLGAKGDALQEKISVAATATVWPRLSPTADQVVKEQQAAPGIGPCVVPNTESGTQCTWGTSGGRSALLLGDSVAVTYATPLREIAMNPSNNLSLTVLAMYGCPFVDHVIDSKSTALNEACPGRREREVRQVIAQRPEIVFISNNSSGDTAKWSSDLDSYLRRIVPFAKSVVILAKPPASTTVDSCYPQGPAACLSRVSDDWIAMSRVQQNLAAKYKNVTYIDSRPFFCTFTSYCPAFVGTTLTRIDLVHMSTNYGQMIAPALAEEFQRSGLI